MKYIIFHDQDAVLFPEWMNHDEVGLALSKRFGQPTSAGFVTIADEYDSEDPCCFGKSESLKLESKPGDSKTVGRALRIRG